MADFPEQIHIQEFQYVTGMIQVLCRVFITQIQIRMRNKPRWQSRLALLLLPVSSVSSMTLFGTQSPILAQAKPSDLQGHWAQSCIQALAQRGVLMPYTDGSFRPNDVISRTEYAVTIQRAFPQVPPVQKPIRFRDVPPNSPAAKAIQYIQQSGFWLAEGRDEFRPTASLSRAQAFGGLANGLRYPSRQVASSDLRVAFKDGRMVPDYTRTAVAAALDNRLIINYPDVRQFNPNQPIRRAELATALCQVFPATVALVPPQYVANSSVPVSVRPTPTPSPNPGSGAPVIVVPGPRPPGSIRPGDIVIPGTGPIFYPPVMAPPMQPTQEIRGVWLTNIDSLVLFNSRSLQDAMQQLAQLNFNTVYPVVWNWGYTVYPSEVARRITGYAIDPRYPGLNGRDPLAELIAQGRQKRIAVIPWFEFGFMAPADSELATRYPSWLTQRRDGSKVWKEGEFDRVWLNPFRPEVQQFTLDLITEIVTKYNIDGIQFDDHMGLPSDFGYDPYTIELYKKENPGKEPPANPKDPAWLKWRADKITEFMGRVFRAIKARKPDVTVALSPNSQKFSYENYLQDWITWKRRGYVEELMLQVYRTDINAFAAELMQPEVQEARMHIPVGVGILTGLRNNPVSMSIVQQKLQKVRELGFSGASFFFYETLWNLSNESPEFRKEILRGLLSSPVPRPSVAGGWVPTSGSQR